MTEDQEIPYSEYLYKSIKWLLGNAFFGLIPLWFILFINIVSGGKAGSEEIDHIVVHDGVILFVCCAIMGSVLVDYIVAGIKMKISLAYRLAIIPCFIIMLIITDY